VITRHLHDKITQSAKKYPLISLVGPRQSGKTTLAKQVFPTYQYVNFEHPEILELATTNPIGFFQRYSHRVILDEIQKVPHLFSYLQVLVDQEKEAGRFVLTGSQQFLLNRKISQTLAGRTCLFRLLPFSLDEMENHLPWPFWQKEKKEIQNKTLRPLPKRNLTQMLFRGFYPPVIDRDFEPQPWYRDYFQTYVSRDLRDMLNIGDLLQFERFVRILASRVGQLIDLTSLGNDAGVSHTTTKRWLSVLEASFIINRLEPHFRNFSKRLIKSPKIYFLDTGLLCYLLRIASPDDLIFHPQWGGIFESYVISEMYKYFYNNNLDAPLYFWRDRTGHEIDLIIDLGKELFPLEIKASQTYNSDFAKNLTFWLGLKKNPQKNGAIIYGGTEFQTRDHITVLPWFM
jgi:predicted AAA+ superfamily ATPase